MGASGSSGETTCFCFASDKISAAPPIRVTVTGAGGQVGYSLLPMIAKGDMFGRGRRIILNGLDLSLKNTQDSMRALHMELQDGHFPLLQKVNLTTVEEEAFEGADYAILLGAFPRQDNRDDRALMEKNVIIFRTFGRGIEKYASKNCKVIVVGNPSNTNAYIVSEFARKLPKQNFTAVTRLMQNRATGQIAEKAGVPLSAVRNVIVWGRHQSGTEIPDVEHTLVNGRAATQVLSSSKKWLDEELPAILNNRAKEIAEARKAAAAISPARAIVDHVRDLHLGSRSGEMVSMGVWSKGNSYGVNENLIYSFPVICKGGGQFKVCSGLRMSAAMKEYLKKTESSLIDEHKLAKEVIAKQDTKKLAK